DALLRSITMHPAEQRERMASLRMTVREFNVYRWAGRMLADAGRTRLRERIVTRWERRPMRHLFTSDGEKALQAVMQGHPVLAFDFDGTLAPIVARPDEAHMPAVVSEGLARLA